MPVREAFRALELEGLIRGLPRRKAVVVALQPEDVADIFDILATVEARALERAAPQLDAALDHLRRLHEARRTTDEPVRLLDLDVELHAALTTPGGSRHGLLTQAHRNTLRPYMLATGFVARRRGENDAEHAAILDALARGDHAAAVEAVAAHARSEGHDLVQLLRARLSPSPR